MTPTFSMSFIKHPGPAAMMTSSQEEEFRRLNRKAQVALTALSRLNMRAVVTISIDIQKVPT